LKDASVVRRRAGRKRPEFDESGTSPSSLSCWIRFSARGAHLAWRVKNGAKSVPFKTLKTLTEGSELVLLRESDSMLGKRRREKQDKTLPRLPDTVARLVSFTITARTARRAKTTTIKVLTTLLDPDACPAREIAALYAERWQVERPASGNDPIALLIADILAQPAHRQRPTRTSGRTAFQRQHWHTEEISYTISITPSNLPKADINPGS
jgi:hypothetical protein